MATVDDVLRIRYEADIARLKRELAEIPDQTGEAAKKAAAEIERLTKELEKMTEQAERSGDDASDAMDKASKSANQLSNAGRSVAQQLPDVWVQLQGGVDPLTVLTQQGFQVVQSNMELFMKGLKSVTTFMTGPWGIAVAGVVAGIAVLANSYSEVTEESRLLQVQVEQLSKALDPVMIDASIRSYEGLLKIQADLRDEMYLLNGEMTKSDKVLFQTIELIHQESHAYLLSLGQVYAKKLALTELIQVQLDSNELSFKEEVAARKRLETAKKELEIAEKELKTGKDEVKAAEDAAIAIWAKNDAIEGEVKTRTKRTKAAEKERDLDEILNEQMQQTIRLNTELSEIIADANEVQFDEIQAINAKYDEQIQKIEKIAALQGDLGKIQEARTAVESARLAELDKYYEEYDEKRRQEHQSQLESAKNLARQEQDIRITAAQQTLGAIETFGRIGVEKEGENAMISFRIQQASAMAQVAIQTVVAASRALADLGPIAGAIAAAGIAAAGLGQEAAIASQQPPQFYTGGFADTAGMPAILHPNEAVLNSAARSTLGDDNIRALNRGQQMRAPSMSIQIDGRNVASAAARQVQRGGRLSDEITRRSGKLGRR